MSRITDKTISNEAPTISAEQISESESIQKSEQQGKAPMDAEHQQSLQPVPPEDAKVQIFESRLGGMARQVELQSQFPITSSELKELPDDLRPGLDPNFQLDQNVDVTKNIPGGRTIDGGLAGMTDLSGKGIKSGPNHMGVDLSTGGMKTPDVIADVLDAGKLGGPNPSAPKQDGGRDDVKSVDGGGVKASTSSGGGQFTPPPGVQLGARAPQPNLVSGESGGVGNTNSDDLKAFAGIAEKSTGPTAKEQIEARKDAMSASSGKEHADWLKKTNPDGGTKMTDPDASGGSAVGTQLSPEELARLIAVRGGDTDPVRGHEGTFIEGDKPKVRYGDLVTDGGGEDDGGTNVAGGDSSSGGVIPGGGFTDPTRPGLAPDGPPPKGGNDPSGNPS